MKMLSFLLLCLFLNGSCKKDQSLANIVSNIIGVYNTTMVCNAGTLLNPVYDTTYNFKLQVNRMNDTIISTNADLYYYIGYVYNNTYVFSDIMDQSSFIIDTKFKTMNIVVYTPFVGGDCILSGNKL